MKKSEWRDRIKESCIEAGTYQAFCDDVIDTLSEIMENRDGAQAEYRKTGSKPVIEKETSTGAITTVKNPLLVMVNDLNAAALTYWRDLGLTPKGFTAMQKNGFKPKETSFEQILANIGI